MTANVSSQDRPLYEVRDTGAKGLAVFAVQDIAAGTLLISEEPLIAVPSGAGMNSLILQSFDDLTPEQRIVYISLASRKIPEEDNDSQDCDLYRDHADAQGDEAGGNQDLSAAEDRQSEETESSDGCDVSVQCSEHDHLVNVDDSDLPVQSAEQDHLDEHGSDMPISKATSKDKMQEQTHDEVILGAVPKSTQMQQESTPARISPISDEDDSHSNNTTDPSSASEESEPGYSCPNDITVNQIKSTHTRHDSKSATPSPISTNKISQPSHVSDSIQLRQKGDEEDDTNEHEPPTPSPEQIINIFQTNALGCESSTPNSTPLAVICPLAARLNHSCIPNVFCALNPLTNQHTVYTIKAIAAGEEVNTSYILSTYTIGSQRKAELGKWGFKCGCVVCVPGVVGEKSDMRRAELGTLKEKADGVQIRFGQGLLTTQGARMGAECALRMVGLMQEEGLVGADLADL